MNKDEDGNIFEQWCMLQVASDPDQRNMVTLSKVLKDCDTVASFAHRFNMQVAQEADGTEIPNYGPDDATPDVTICAPSILKVDESPVRQFLAPGAYVAIYPYRWTDVQKFVFEGAEAYLELPQAFFHYVTWLSGGSSLITDLQGIESDSGSVLLINPSVVHGARSPAPSWGVDTLFKTLSHPGYKPAVDNETTSKETTPSQELFNRLHPHCGPLCQHFDPGRRAKPLKRHCGVPLQCGG